MADANKKIASLQAQLQSSSIAFQKLEAELAGTIEARQRLDSQLSENELVLKEFTTLKSHNTVYKLVGPSLVPQDANEAKVNVEKRLEFIRSEIKRVEAQLKEGQEKAAKKKDEIIGLQQQFQALQPPSGPQAVQA
ncbi:prefoldin beta subunit [Kwoniella heveanensis CBS 569]|nr:prefoldin beta subunit [Kwoniella heveanensis CBS 569]